MLRRHWLAAAVLVGLPLLVAVITPVQLFAPPGWVDPGVYVGYFLNLPEFVERFGADYQSMRLPWVISGYALNALLPPTLAHHVLILGVHLVATVSLYAIVMPRYGRPAGFLAVAMVTVNPLWIVAVTRGYVDGPSVALALACFAVCANLQAFSSRWLPAALVGVLGSLAAFTHPVVGVFTLVGAISWVVAQRREVQGVGRMALIAAVAGVITSFVLGAISLAVNGPFLFWSAMFEFTKRVADGYGASYARPMADWLPSAYLMFILGAVLLSGLVALFFSRRDRQRSELLKVGCGTFATSLVLLGLVALKSGSTVFQAPFSVNFLLPGLVLVLGGLAGEALTGRQLGSRGRWLAVAAGVFVVGFLPLIAAAVIWGVEAKLRADHLLWMLLAGAAIAACVLLRKAKLLAVLLVVGSVGLAGVADPATRSVYEVDGNPSYKPIFLAQHRVNDFVRDQVDPTQLNVTPFFWYDRADFQHSEAARKWLWYYLWFNGKPNGLTVYDSVASVWLWDQRELLLGTAMPAMDPARRSRLLQFSQVRVIAFCGKPAQCEQAERALQLPGRVARLRAEKRIVEPPYLDFTVAIIDVDPAER